MYPFSSFTGPRSKRNGIVRGQYTLPSIIQIPAPNPLIIHSEDAVENCDSDAVTGSALSTTNSDSPIRTLPFYRPSQLTLITDAASMRHRTSVPRCANFDCISHHEYTLKFINEVSLAAPHYPHTYTSCRSSFPAASGSVYSQPYRRITNY